METLKLKEKFLALLNDEFKAKLDKMKGRCMTMKKRLKYGVGLVSVLGVWAMASALAMAEVAPVGERFMLNKYSPYQAVDYQAENLTVVDSRVCIHGDKLALDILYSAVLEKTTQPSDGAAPEKETRELAVWVCQSERLEKGVSQR